jgi:hypothetical protein
VKQKARKKELAKIDICKWVCFSLSIIVLVSHPKKYKKHWEKMYQDKIQKLQFSYVSGLLENGREYVRIKRKRENFCIHNNESFSKFDNIMFDRRKKQKIFKNDQEKNL